MTGECFNDSAFDESVTFNDATPTTTVLTVASGERHDGTEGTGARVVRTSDAVILALNIDMTVKWLELDLNGNRAVSMISHGGSSGQATSIQNMILHGDNGALSSLEALRNASNRLTDVTNCFVYDIVQTAGGSQGAIGIGIPTNTTNIMNCTVFGVLNNNGSGDASAINGVDDADLTLQNVLALGTGGTASGTIQDFAAASYVNATVSNNGSSDTSSSGTGSTDSLTSGDEIVSTTGGSEDLHLKSGATSIDLGTDKGTTPTGVNIDINGRDRDGEGDTWDYGAHEFVSVAGVTVPIFDHHYRMTRGQ